jgi:hypothetical protein
MAWSVYCKDCDLQFSLHSQPQQTAGPHNQIALTCPYCGHSAQYTPLDLIRAMEAQAGT